MWPRWRKETSPGDTFEATKPHKSLIVPRTWQGPCPWAPLCSPCRAQPISHNPTHAACSEFPSLSSLQPPVPSSPCPGLTQVTFPCGKSVQKFLRCLWALAAASPHPRVSHSPQQTQPSALLRFLRWFCPCEYLKSNKNTNIWILDTSQPQPYLSYLALLLELGPEEAPNDLGYLKCCA